MQEALAIFDAWSLSSSEGIIWIDAQHTVQRINRSAIHLLDLPGPPDKWEGRPIWDIVQVLRKATSEATEQVLTDARLAERQPGIPREGLFTHGLRTIQWHSLPLTSLPETPSRLVILRDTTEIRLLRELRHDLADIVRDRIQAPLSALTPLLRDLAGSIPPAPQHTTYIERLQKASDSTRAIVAELEDFLELNRLRSGELPLSPSVFSLRELLDQVVELAQNLATARHLSLIPHIAEPLPLTWGDRDLIQRVLNYLIAHAVTVSPPGSQVKVDAALAPTQHDKIRIAVSTPTFQATPQPLEAVTLPAQQEDAGDRRTMAFCRTVLAAHGERIWMSSPASDEASIAFTLPQVSAALQQVRAHVES